LDSLIIQLSIAPAWAYIFKPSFFAWNLPKKANVEKSLFFRIMCYLGKCILLPNREDKSEIKKAMDIIQFLLKNKQYILLFPEGTRSNTGRIDDQNFSYGAGELLQAVPSAKVLCIYQRGDEQVSKSKFPKRGETFSVYLKLIKPISHEKGLRGSRDLSRQIVKTLVDMEQEYFARK
jgi:1-acyl-sn-glycerol-3-phosphate acyltransferase